MSTAFTAENRPFHDRDGHIWFDGRMIPWRDANVHLLTHALHYASSVFEGEKAYNGKVFRLTDHSMRLIRSAEILDMQIPYTVAELDAATEEVASEITAKELYIRPVAWRGSEMMGVSGQKNKIHVAIAAWPALSADFDNRLKGIALDWVNWVRPAPNMAPTAAKASGLYMIGTLAKHAAEAKGYQDALLLDYKGRVAEATTANFFLVMDGALHTPSTECILNGITRQTIMELANGMGIPVIERDIMPSELSGATEVFMTGTAAEVTPINRIGNVCFKPGHITEALMHVYDKAVGRII